MNRLPPIRRWIAPGGMEPETGSISRRRPSLGGAAGAAVVVSLFLVACGGQQDQAVTTSGAGVQAFTNANIFDGTGAPMVNNAVMLVQNGRITAIGPASQVQIPNGAEVVDLGGRYVIPGLLNAHAHVEDPTGSGPSVREQLEQYAYYGVTTVLSLGEDPPEALALRADRESPTLRHARLWAAGQIFTPLTAEEAESAVHQLASQNVDWVKIRVDSFLGTQQKMPPEAYETVIRTATSHNIPVAVHMVELEDAKGVLRAGARLIAHSVRDQIVDQEFIDLMLSSGVCYVPTLTRELSTFVYADRPDFFDDPFFLERAAPADLDAFLSPDLREAQSTGANAVYYREALPRAEENMRILKQAGVPIAFGTDSGTRFPGRFQGYMEHLELEMVVDAGLTPQEALVSATGTTARCIGLEGVVGTLVPGAFADFIVLNANPLEDILNTRQVHSVRMGGNLVR